MKVFASFLLAALGCSGVVRGQTWQRAAELEAKGDAAAAGELLQREARSEPDNASAVLRYAEFLDRYDDPETRETYAKALALEPGGAERARVARRLVVLDLIAGDRTAAARDLETYRAAGGSDWPGGLPARREQAAGAFIEVPGPLRSFQRMAALAPQTEPGDVLPALARNVITNGYQASTTGEALEPTEYMKLLTRYLSQARELTRLAGPGKALRVETCDSANAGELLRIVGYRMRGGCGSDVVLETVNASRAFLTIDSGFPIADLEQALRTNRPFVYDYAPTRVPVLYGTEYWLTKKDRQAGEFIDAFLSDPTLCRAYLGMAKLDPPTADALRKAVPVARLKAFAHVLDFFGGMFEIRDEKALVPGGPRSAAAWAELAGASPDHGAAFLEKLISRDDGWMASFYDALARAPAPVQEYLTEPARLKRFYLAVRGRVTSPGPARPVFRSNTEMMLLTTRLRVDGGRVQVPGNLEVWKNLFISHPNRSKYDSRLAKAAAGWKESDDLIEGLFGMCRKLVDNEPLRIFMALSDLDRWRAKPLEPATVEFLARHWKRYGAQYSLFNESPALTDATMVQYIETARAIDRIGDRELRANTAGTLQALAAMWQIFVRQGSIPAPAADQTLAWLASRFSAVRGHRELFDAGRAGVDALLAATGPAAGVSPQDRVLDLLAGASRTSDPAIEARMVQEMVRIFEAQRLISLKLLFDVSDNLDAVAKGGGKVNAALVNRVSGRIAEVEAPRADLTTVEKNTLSFGYWAERHIQLERRINLKAAIARAGSDPEKLGNLRSLLAPFLRDTLVGLVYSYYAPPGGQILMTNPLFVRSHDFVGLPSASQTWRATELVGSGWPSSAGGRLLGSLSGLPYALAEAEQNFLVPAREQALIWADLTPQLILSVTVPRWWRVKPALMHWVGLHMRYGETLAAEAALDGAARERLAAVLGRHAQPARVYRATELLSEGEVREALDEITPAELFLAARAAVAGGAKQPLAEEIQRVERRNPGTVSYAAVSEAFGTPKPTLTNSYRPELLYLRTFPTLMGYSSRIMAESWESSTLYWAAVADSVHVPPDELNLLIPDWTRRTIEHIFATHLEDWPALLRSQREVGEAARLKLRIETGSEQKAALR